MILKFNKFAALASTVLLTVNSYAAAYIEIEDDSDLVGLFREFDTPLFQPSSGFLDRPSELPINLFGTLLSLILEPHPVSHRLGMQPREDGCWHMRGYPREYGSEYSVELLIIPDSSSPHGFNLNGQINLPRSAIEPQPEKQPLIKDASDTGIQSQNKEPANKSAADQSVAAASKQQPQNSDDEKLRVYLEHVKQANGDSKTIAYREGEMMTQMPMGMPRPQQSLPRHKRLR